MPGARSSARTQRSFLLPIETFGYQYALGGYHAVLSGFLLLFLALTIIVALPRHQKTVRARLGICARPHAAADTVLQRLGVSSPGGIGQDLENLGPTRLGPLGIALSGERCGARRVCSASLSCRTWCGTDHVRLQLVTLNERAPIVQFLIVFWPLIVLALAVPLAGQARSFAGFLAAVFFGLLVFTELINFYDGGYTGEFAPVQCGLEMVGLDFHWRGVCDFGISLGK